MTSSQNWKLYAKVRVFLRLVAKYHVQRPWTPTNVLHLPDLHSSSNQDFIAKCNIVREVLKDLYEQNEKPSIETLGSLMHEVHRTFALTCWLSYCM